MTKFPGRWLWLVGLLAAILMVAVACEEEEKEPSEETPSAAELKTDFGVTDTEIILGATMVQSGNVAAAAYAPIPPTMQAYFTKVNQEDGGVCDRQIRFIVEDDQYAPATALEKARKLVEQDQVVAFVGNLGTAAVTGQVDYINDPNDDGDTSDGVPHLFVSTGASKWGDYEKWPWTMSHLPQYLAEGKILATYLNDNFPDQTAGILYQNDDFGKDGRDGFKEVFEGDIVAEQSYEATATDVTSQLANLRDADPDILYLYSLPITTAQTFAYMEANDWHPQVVQSYVNGAALLGALVGGEGGAEAGFEKLAGTISTNYLLDPVADADDPAMQEHQRILETYSDLSVSNFSVYAQSLAELMVKTLQIACENGDMTRAGVLAAAESIQGFRTSLLYPGIEINLGPTDRFAIQALVPTEVQSDGTLKALGEPISVE